MMDAADAAAFRQNTHALLGVLGRDWVAGQSKDIADAKLASHPPIDTRARFIFALSRIDAIQDALDHGKHYQDHATHFYVALIAHSVRLATEAPGGDRLAKRLRHCAHAGDFAQLFDVIFEAEAAANWLLYPQTVEITVPEHHHPDFWHVFAIGQRRFRLAHECKRIQPEDSHEVERERLLDLIEDRLRVSAERLGALKVVVLVRARPQDLPTQLLLGDLEQLAEHADKLAEDRWLTTGDPCGIYQISVSRARAFDSLQERPLALPDIPGNGPLRVALEERHVGKPLNPVRLKYAVALRSNILPDRVGALERNLHKAVTQVALSEGQDAGMIDIRIRPPRGLGDLYEADRGVRRVLRDAPHIALVTLYWNEAEEAIIQGPVPHATTGHTVLAQYHLRCHYIANPRHPMAPVFTALDSASARFPATDGIFIRDITTGELTPVPGGFLRSIEAADEIAESAPQSEPESEAATMVFELARPFPERLADSAFPPIKRGRITIAPAFDADLNIHFIQFTDRQPVAAATIDLRASIGATKFCFQLHWKGDRLLSIAQVDAKDRRVAVARASPVRQSYL